MPKIDSLHYYPIKSCAGIETHKMQFDQFGPAGDRRWMIITDEANAGHFITQRNTPKLALIRCEIVRKGALKISIPGIKELQVDLSKAETRLIRSTVWRDECDTRDAGDEIAAALSNYLDQEARLVGIDESFSRQVRGNPDDQVGFADTYPLLVISKASLKLLNSKLGQSIPMDRFRPNIVIKDCEAFAEDSWNRIQIGDTILKAAGPCVRCITTTINQTTGEKTGPEPLKTLASFRKTKDGVIFGQNYINLSKEGRIEVGMTVEVVE